MKEKKLRQPLTCGVLNDPRWRTGHIGSDRARRVEVDVEGDTWKFLLYNSNIFKKLFE